MDSVRAVGGEAAGFVADVSEPDAVQGLVGPVTRQLGQPDIVVNNAGVYSFRKLENTTIEDWRRVCAVNLESALLTTQAFLPGMKERGWG